MNKADLISMLATKDNLTVIQATHIVILIFDGFKDDLAKGDRIEIRGFGCFTMREYKSYTGRNPRTGMQIEVKSKSSTYFKVGKELQKRLNFEAF